METPHVHSELIKKWADGAKIECFCPDDSHWWEIDSPRWDPRFEYRVKPSPIKKYHWVIITAWGEYAVTTVMFSEDEMNELNLIPGNPTYVQKIDSSMTIVYE